MLTAATLMALGATALLLAFQNQRSAAIGAFWAGGLALADGAMSAAGAMVLVGFVAGCGVVGHADTNAQAHGHRRWVVVALWALWLFAAALMLHLVPGFRKTIWAEPLLIKARAALFCPEYRVQHVLAACALSVTSGQRWARRWWPERAMRMLRAVAPTAWGLAALMPAALVAHKIEPDAVAWPLVPLFVVHNVLLVVIPEEILFRGLLPHLLQRSLPLPWAQPRAVALLSSAVFGLGHLPHGALLAVLSFVAGLGYDAACRRTGGLSGGIVAHAAVNVVHFACFTYPALA